MRSLEKHISPEAAASIRQRAETLILAGEGFGDLVTEESARYGVSTAQVAATAAHLRYAATQALNAVGLDQEKIDRDSFIQIAVRLRSTQSELMKVNIVSDSSLITGLTDVDPQTIVKAAALYDSKLQAKPGGAPWINADPNATELSVDSLTLPKVEQLIENSPLVGLRNGGASLGATAGYDFPAKQKWHSLYIEECLKFRDPKIYPDTKIVGLFGPAMKDAIKLIDAGYKPQNIYTVERDPNVRSFYYQTAERLGVNPLWGDLGAAVSNCKVKFEIAICDFTGPLSRSTVTALERLPLTPDHFVVVNVMGKKESKAIQGSLSHVSKACALIDVLYENSEYRLEIEERNLRVAFARDKAAEETVNEQRGLELLRVIAGSVGAIPFVERKPVGSELARARLEWLNELSPNLDSRLGDRVVHLLMMDGSRNLETLSGIWRSADYALVVENRWKDIQPPNFCPLQLAAIAGLELQSERVITRWKYNSEESRARSPFHSIFIRAKSLDDVLKPAQDLARHLMPLCKAILRDVDHEFYKALDRNSHVHSFEWRISSENGKIRPTGLPVRERDRVVAVYDGQALAWFPVSWIPALNLLADQIKDLEAKSGSFADIREGYIDSDGTVREGGQ